MARSDHTHHDDGRTVTCWDCLTEDDRQRSRDVWQKLSKDETLGFANDPTFLFHKMFFEADVRAGKCIETKRPEQSGHRIVFPYSLFWLLVDTIHEERKQRQ